MKIYLSLISKDYQSIFNEAVQTSLENEMLIIILTMFYSKPRIKYKFLWYLVCFIYKLALFAKYI
jgi:hypothetical protein